MHGDPGGFRSEQEQRFEEQGPGDGSRPRDAFGDIAADEGSDEDAGDVARDSDERMESVAVEIKMEMPRSTVLPVMLATKEWAMPK
jgi:hypothetical protein